MFALRVHFLLWGSFAATVNGVSVTGDYRRTGPPRLVLKFANGEVTIWSASLRILDSADAREEYDFTADILSESWNRRSALRKVKTHGREEIADVLLDQSIFAGVGNIIKNEVLFRTRTSPFTKVSRLAPTQLRRIADEARVFSFRFLELRREFALRKHLEIYGRSTCPSCKGKVSRKVHGERAAVFSARSASTRVHGEANPSRSSPA
jgi:endonuclease-8